MILFGWRGEWSFFLMILLWTKVLKSESSLSYLEWRIVMSSPLGTTLHFTKHPLHTLALLRVVRTRYSYVRTQVNIIDWEICLCNKMHLAPKCPPFPYSLIYWGNITVLRDMLPKTYIMVVIQGSRLKLFEVWNKSIINEIASSNGYPRIQKKKGKSWVKI